MHVTKRCVVALAIGLMAFVSAATATAEPATPVSPVPPSPAAPAPPAAGSTTDELADMVLDAIAHQGATPTSPAPAPPR
jgi:hypothetical protein